MLDAARNSWPRASGQIADSDRGSNSAQIIFVLHKYLILETDWSPKCLKAYKKEHLGRQTDSQTDRYIHCKLRVLTHLCRYKNKQHSRPNQQKRWWWFSNKDSKRLR